MDLKEIISISGKPGLYKVIARSAKNFIVESIDDQKTRLSVNITQQVAVLDEITLYTNTEDNIPIKTVFENMEAKMKDGPIPSPKDNPVDIREFFNFAAPGYDKDRVYISDMKKMLKWFETVHALKQAENITAEQEPETKAEPEKKAETEKKAQPKKKAETGTKEEPEAKSETAIKKIPGPKPAKKAKS